MAIRRAELNEIRDALGRIRGNLEVASIFQNGANSFRNEAAGIEAAQRIIEKEDFYKQAKAIKCRKGLKEFYTKYIEKSSFYHAAQHHQWLNSMRQCPRVSTNGARSQGEYLPLSVWVQRGFDGDIIAMNCKDVHMCDRVVSNLRMVLIEHVWPMNAETASERASFHKDMLQSLINQFPDAMICMVVRRGGLGCSDSLIRSLRHLRKRKVLRKPCRNHVPLTLTEDGYFAEYVSYWRQNWWCYFADSYWAWCEDCEKWHRVTICDCCKTWVMDPESMKIHRRVQVSTFYWDTYNWHNGVWDDDDKGCNIT